MNRSPFPGMDPYLEGDMWSEFHDTLAHQIRGQLMPLLQPTYVALLSKYYVIDQSGLGIVDAPGKRSLYPDVHLVGYQRLFDYNQLPPPPAFDPDNLAWIKSRISVEEEVDH